MKKILIAVGASLLFSATYAQNGKVTAVSSLLQSYLADHDAASLENALPYINDAVKDSTTMNKAKTWWYRAQLYFYIANEKSLQAKYPDASIESLNSFEKIIELNDPKWKSWDDANERMGDLAAITFNEGADAFQKQKFDKSSAAYLRVVKIDSLTKLKGGKLAVELSPALEYAGIAARNGELYPQAALVYEKLIVQSPDSVKYYDVLYKLYMKQDKKPEAVAAVDKGLAKSPNNYDLLIDKVNSYLSENKNAEAIDYLKKLIEQDPKNEQLSSVLGISYQNAGDNENAEKTFQSLLATNPESYSGNYGMGTIWYNKAANIQEQINALGNTKADYEKGTKMEAERNKNFEAAKPYLEKAVAGKATDDNAERLLKKINLYLGK